MRLRSGIVLVFAAASPALVEEKRARAGGKCVLRGPAISVLEGFENNPPWGCSRNYSRNCQQRTASDENQERFSVSGDFLRASERPFIFRPSSERRFSLVNGFQTHRSLRYAWGLPSRAVFARCAATLASAVDRSRRMAPRVSSCARAGRRRVAGCRCRHCRTHGPGAERSPRPDCRAHCAWRRP